MLAIWTDALAELRRPTGDLALLHQALAGDTHGTHAALAAVASGVELVRLAQRHEAARRAQRTRRRETPRAVIEGNARNRHGSARSEHNGRVPLARDTYRSRVGVEHDSKNVRGERTGAAHDGREGRARTGNDGLEPRKARDVGEGVPHGMREVQSGRGEIG